MLTEKQLQALVGCGEKEDCTRETCPMFETCDIGYADKVAAEAAKTALAYREMLERLEWASVSLSSLPALKSTCPICCCLKDEGHAEDCELAALLKESEGEA
jgi:hypothetical protein